MNPLQSILQSFDKLKIIDNHDSDDDDSDDDDSDDDDDDDSNDDDSDDDDSDDNDEDMMNQVRSQTIQVYMLIFF
jgi:hypothetical protein